MSKFKTEKLCRHCNETLPYEAFRSQTRVEKRPGKGKGRTYVVYDTHCRGCRNAESVEKKILRREGMSRVQLARMVKDLHSQLDPDTRTLPKISELIREILECFQSLRCFAKGWYESIMAADPGSNAQLNAYKAVAQLLVTANEVERGGKDVDDMSEEDLRKELNVLFEQWMSSLDTARASAENAEQPQERSP